MRRRTTPEELDAISSDPRAGEVWWCEGSAIGLNDGGKTRPVVVLSVSPAGGARVLPLTSRKPEGAAVVVPVSHRGGLSWMVNAAEARTVARTALVSSLGAWAGFSAWKKAGAGGGRDG